MSATVAAIRTRTPAPVAPGWLRSVSRPVLRTWLRLVVEGQEHVPARGPVIVASTHLSYLDVPTLGIATDRPFTFLGAAELAGWPVLGPFLPPLGLIPVRRGAGDAEAIERCLAALAFGAALAVFPEGARSRDGRVYRPRSGVARLAAAAGCQVVPVGVAGTGDAWPAGGSPRVRRGRVVVRFGAPIEPPAGDPGSRRAFADRLHEQLVALSGAPAATVLLPRSAE